MSDRLDSTSSPPAEAASARVRYVDLSRLTGARFVNQMLGATFVAGAIPLLVAAFRYFTGSRLDPTGPLGLTVLLWSAAAVLVLVRLIVHFRWRRNRRRVAPVLAAPGSHSPEEVIAAALMEMDGSRALHLFRREDGRDAMSLARRLRQLGVEPPAAIVDERFRSSLSGISIPEEFLEAETVVSQPRRRLVWMLLFGYVIAMYIYSFLWPALIRGDVLGAVGVTVLIAYFAIPLARALGWRIGEWRAPIVTMGAVEVSGERRWTVADSCLYVAKSQIGGEMIDAILLGPAGVLAMRFWGPGDAGFVLLWQRWMHPHPRLELR